MAKIKDIFIFALIGLLNVSLFSKQVNASFPYYGTKIGALTRLHHAVAGDVYAVDSRTLFIKNFNYDGDAPAAYFYVGNTPKPSNAGAQRLRDERGSTGPLTRRYRNKDITLSLPDGKTLRDIKWFSVWCDEFAVNFGDVSIPSNLEFPRPQKIAALKGVHGVSSDNIVIVDAQTLLVPNFSYDGEAPDAKFWVGRGQRPTPQGLRIPDENGKENPLRRYDRKTIVLTLPGDLTIFDIGHFGVWCEAFTVDFGHVPVPEGLNVPPSLKMLGVSPQSKLNCEVLYDDLAFEVRWAVAGESIVIQLVAKLANNEYMSFGISPSKDRSVMIGSDVVVAWVDRETGKGFAQDYYLDDKAQCSGKRGTCPDVNIQDNTNSIRLLNAAMVNGYSIVTYQRSLQATDKLDLPILVNGTLEAIVWAIGPLNERKEASFHTHYTKRTHSIDFGRQPTWNCPMPEGTKAPEENAEESRDTTGVAATGYPPASTPHSVKLTQEPEEEFYDNRPQALHRPNRRQESQSARPVPTPKPVNGSKDAWDIPPIQCFEPEDGVFYAQMGPTGGKHGYSAITGHVGWGISWYINGLLIPEIHVVRGKTYTFVVEGGNNPDIPAQYHPFYITDDPVGGYEHKRDEEKQSIRIFAGVHRSRNGQVTPTGVGRLCNWTPTTDGPPADDYLSFGAYQRTLSLKCNPGEPGVITWKPDQNTPDTVYYHCFTHRYLGWKIHVHNSCDDARFAASEKHEVRVPAAAAATAAEDIAADASIRHETKVSPNDNFLLKHQSDLIKNHNMNGTPPKLTFEITQSSEITKLISDGIRAAEALEESILRNNHIDKHSTSGAIPIGPLNSNPTSNLKQQIATSGAGQGPYILTEAPEILQGELHQHQHHHPHHQQQLQQQYHNQNILIYHKSQTPPPPPSLHMHAQSQATHVSPHLSFSHLNHVLKSNITNIPIQSQKTISLSEYLRPPQNAPLFQPVKLPGRRPFPGPLKKVPPSKPVLPQHLPRHPLLQPQLSGSVPQPSVIVNHYRKPVPGLLKPFIKENSFPISPIAASVLLLGQPTEVGNHRKSEPVLHHKAKPVIPVPYSDLVPQDTLQNNVLAFNTNFPKEKKPLLPAKVPSHIPESIKTIPLPLPVTTTATVFKKPYDIHQVQDDSLSPDIATMKIAVNDGFKPDSVVVESGFRPIIRRDGVIVEDSNQIASRREDPGSEIDEVMETDTLFLTAQQDTQTQNFEPMFIPSPPDSTNTTTIIKKVIAPAVEDDEPIYGIYGTAAKLQNSTLDELLTQPSNKGDSSEEEATIRSETENNEHSSIEERNDEETDLAAALEDDGFERDEEFDEEFNEDDREAQAAERVDTYYLPPDNRKIEHANIPSGAVVTYDGKSVIDSSLVLPPKLDSHDTLTLQQQHNTGISKIEQLIRSTPQFKPFRGEIPPSIPDFLSTEQTLTSGIRTITERTRTNPNSSSSTTLFSASASLPPSSLTNSAASTLSSSISSSSRPISTKLQMIKTTA